MREAVGMDGRVRAAAEDRERVAERLRRAHADGRIDLEEFDERLAGTYAARTYAELEPLTVDLPVDRAAPIERAGSIDPGRPRPDAPRWLRGPRSRCGSKVPRGCSPASSTCRYGRSWR